MASAVLRRGKKGAKIGFAAVPMTDVKKTKGKGGEIQLETWPFCPIPRQK